MTMKQIPKHENYLISEDGIVYRLKGEQISEIKPDCSNGYARVKLDGENNYIHKLVAESFIRQPNPEKNRVFHIDGDKFNNHRTNLCWMTMGEVQQWSRYLVSYRINHFTP